MSIKEIINEVTEIDIVETEKNAKQYFENSNEPVKMSWHIKNDLVQ